MPARIQPPAKADGEKNPRGSQLVTWKLISSAKKAAVIGRGWGGGVARTELRKERLLP